MSRWKERERGGKQTKFLNESDYFEPRGSEVSGRMCVHTRESVYIA